MIRTPFRTSLALLILLVVSIPLVYAFVYQQQSENVTQTVRNVPYFYVANNTSDVDSSGDKGLHSDFTAQQQGPDSTFDSLTEEAVGEAEALEDYVDNNLSNADSSEDKGTHSNFSAQQSGPDAIYDVLTEVDTSGTVWVWQEDTGGYGPTSSYETYQFWSRWTTNSTTSGTITKIGIYVFADPGNSPKVKLGIYDDSGGSPNNLLGETNAATITGAGWLDIDIVGSGVTISASTTYYIAHITDIAPITQWRYLKAATPVSNYRDFRVWPNLFDPSGFTSKSSAYRYGAYRVGYEEPTTYELDLEVQFTDLLDFLAHEELCIYAGALGAEDLRVDYWAGADWENLATDMTANSWNNYTVSLTSPTFTVRFKGGTETEDTAEDQWQIDTVLLRAEGNANLEDAVDNDTSDVDASADKGAHSNFSAQQLGPDATFDTLTESTESANMYSLDATGGYMIVGNGTPDWGSPTGTISFWVKMDFAIQGRFWGQHGDMETRWFGPKLVLDWGSDSSMTSATSFSANKWYFIAIVWDENNNDLFLYIGDENNAPTVDANSLSGTWLSTTPLPTQNRFMNGVGASEPVDGHGDDLRYWNVVRTYTQIQSDYDVELSGSEANLRSYFKLNNNFDDIGPNNDDGSGSGSYAFSTDVAFPGVEINYELDLEVQFTDLLDFLAHEELCIYAGALGAEDLRVDYWAGADWENLATDMTANSWNNYTVSLTSPTFTVRFKGGTETEDTAEDQWQIDTVLLRSEGTVSREDAVDNDTSDVDASSDLGNLLNFDDMKTVDSTSASLMETNTLGEVIFVNVAEASATFGTLAQVNKPVNTVEDDFMIALLVSTIASDTDGSTMFSAPSGWTLEHDYTQSAASGQHAYIYWKVAGASEPSSYTWTWTSACGWVAQISTFRGVDTSSSIQVEGTVNQESSSYPTSPSVTTTEENCMIWLYDMCDAVAIPATGGAPGGTTWVDKTEVTSPGNGVGISTAYFVQATAGATGNRDWTLDVIEENSAQQYALKPAPTDYRLDQEVQWTDVLYSLPNEELSIYGGVMGDEDIVVDVWNGSGWETVFTDLSSGWNNASIADWLTSPTFTIRFKDGTEGGDSSPDTWQLDATLIHIWNEGENYELDLEVQWINVDYNEMNEELCIYGGSMGSENLRVDVWYNSAWQNVFTDLSNGWNNVTVTSYLTTSTFTIRFTGSTETNDSIQDNWHIDATLLHTWS